MYYITHQHSIQQPVVFSTLWKMCISSKGEITWSFLIKISLPISSPRAEYINRVAVKNHYLKLVSWYSPKKVTHTLRGNKRKCCICNTYRATDRHDGSAFNRKKPTCTQCKRIYWNLTVECRDTAWEALRFRWKMPSINPRISLVHNINRKVSTHSYVWRHVCVRRHR